MYPTLPYPIQCRANARNSHGHTINLSKHMQQNTQFCLYQIQNQPFHLSIFSTISWTLPFPFPGEPGRDIVSLSGSSPRSTSGPFPFPGLSGLENISFSLLFSSWRSTNGVSIGRSVSLVSSLSPSPASTSVLTTLNFSFGTVNMT